MEPFSSPTELPPVLSRVSSRLHRIESVGLFILGIVLLICIAEFYLYLHHRGASLGSVNSLSTNLIFSTGPSNNPAYYELSSGTPKPLSFSREGDPLLELARQGDASIGIVSHAVSSTSPLTEDLARVTDGTRLTTDGVRKSAVSLSADGKYAAYSTLRTAPGGLFDPALMANYDVSTLDMTTGSSTDYGRGYGPQIVTRAGVRYLFYSNNDGIRIINLSTKRAQDLLFTISSSTAAYSKVTTDGMYLAYFNPVLHEYDAFSLSQDTSGIWVIKPLGRLAPQSSVVAFLGSTLYEVSVSTSSSSTALYSYNLSKSLQATKVYSFADDSSVLQLIP